MLAAAAAMSMPGASLDEPESGRLLSPEDGHEQRSEPVAGPRVGVDAVPNDQAAQQVDCSSARREVDELERQTNARDHLEVRLHQPLLHCPLHETEPSVQQQHLHDRSLVKRRRQRPKQRQDLLVVAGELDGRHGLLVGSLLLPAAVVPVWWVVLFRCVWRRERDEYWAIVSCVYFLLDSFSSVRSLSSSVQTCR